MGVTDLEKKRLARLLVLTLGFQLVMAVANVVIGGKPVLWALILGGFLLHTTRMWLVRLNVSDGFGRAFEYLTFVGTLVVHAVLSWYSVVDLPQSWWATAIFYGCSTYVAIGLGAQIAEQSTQAMELADVEFDALRAATKTFEVLGSLLPKRYANEELGDALEHIAKLKLEGRPSWQLWIRYINAVAWVALNVAKDFVPLMLALWKAFGGKP